eukprot:CAMPEP_0172502426 /NCGR_PEP_ID=MMETSP1066-20121228/159884_1 /TAXON_ID=671091 /ORGANISM="Coscinodiscus wailesii, Strain CCMP2513" /LENGTH=561 /DNA_ID=CAMNT_0013277681 /DNA_START=198 /DNA_END=1881 /DNA_ORIENTATION=-
MDHIAVQSTNISQKEQRQSLRLLLSPPVVITGNSKTLLSASPKPIPVTTLAGFLGSGKTTLLSHVLTTSNKKIALIVNDVAKINIDARLLSGSSSRGNIINLSNGCACCSLSDDLLASLSELVTLSDLREHGGEEGSGGFDAIVVECSGVSEPRGIRNVFQEGELYGMPLLERVRLDTMVTVVDAGSFKRHLTSDQRASLSSTPELFTSLDETAPLSPALLSTLLSSSSASATSVSSLLVSQIETADVILINKVDLSSDEELLEIKMILEALNPRAVLLFGEYGVVDVGNVLSRMGGKGVASAGMVDDHKDLVADVVGKGRTENGKRDENNHDHSHDSHDHDHSHSHAHSHDSHDHDHSHSHAHSHNSHDHSHSHGHDPECTDTSHSHTHIHASSTHEHSFLTSFVYTARKPFHPQRLSKLLSHLPVSIGITAAKENELLTTMMEGLLRSKGFCWLANSDDAAMYWSHAGRAFEMQCWGRWWATLPRDEWPEDSISTILQDFDSETSPIVGDRRQEIVFIGTDINVDSFQSALDNCLLTDDEYKAYEEHKGGDGERLKEIF